MNKDSENPLDLMDAFLKGKELTDAQIGILRKEIEITDPSAIFAQSLSSIVSDFEHYFEDYIKDEPQDVLFPDEKTMNLLEQAKWAGKPMTFNTHDLLDDNSMNTPGPAESKLRASLGQRISTKLLERNGSWAERIESIIREMFADFSKPDKAIYRTALAADMLIALPAVARYDAKSVMGHQMHMCGISGDVWLYGIDHAIRRTHYSFTKQLNKPDEMLAAIAASIGKSELDLIDSNPANLHECTNPALSAVHLAYCLAVASGSDPAVLLHESMLDHVPDKSKQAAIDNVRRYAAHRKLIDFDLTWENQRIRLGANSPISFEKALSGRNRQGGGHRDIDETPPNLAAAATVSEADEFVIHDIPLPANKRGLRRFTIVRNVFPEHQDPNKRHMLISYEDPSFLSDGILINDDERQILYDAKASNKLSHADLPAEVRRILKNGSFHGEVAEFACWMGLNSELRAPQELVDPQLGTDDV